MSSTHPTPPHCHFRRLNLDHSLMHEQIKGTKRFILFPPSASHDMYVYPRLHPSTRQSQVDLRSYAIDRFPRFKKWANATSPRLGTRPLETVLSPGDILYLPPYYWHRASVVGNETAISIGVYTQSLPLTAYPLFKQHGLPWPPHAGAGERIATFREYAIAIAAQLPPSLGQSHVRAGGFACAVLQRCVCLADADATAEGDGAVRRRLKRWVADRYAAIDDPRVVRGVGELVCRSDAAFARLLPSEAPRLPHSRTAWVRTHARALRTNVQQLPNRGEYFSAEAWELELTSLLEDVAGAAVGAELALQLLEWVVGSPVLTTEKCERELHYDGHISTSID
ncbi:hypothetical protein AB1Y20_003017 [Prymnesium parvum]|uniref:JmjC domain-containing protein n=1 Tax=Prymnesium parvum TaxID=97485 RepID=A0AB34JC21_PRYPA